MKLNVGCGRNVLPGWVNLDSYAGPGVDIVVDLEGCQQRASDCPTPIDLANNSVNEFLLSHVIEHINNVLPMMQELHRIAKSDALMTVRCPHGASDDADEDPTHVRRMFPGSFGYFGQPYYWRADYGYRGDWEVVECRLFLYERLHSMNIAERYNAINYERNTIREMMVTLRAVKPIRPSDRALQVWVPPTLV